MPWPLEGVPEGLSCLFAGTQGDLDGNIAQVEPKAKLLVIERVVAFLFARPREGPLLCRLRLPTSIRGVDHATAVAVKRAVDDVCQVPPAVYEMFPVVTELCTTDEHPSNMSAEHSRLQDDLQKGHRVETLHLMCDVHKCSSIAKRMWELSPGWVSGLLHIAKLL